MHHADDDNPESPQLNEALRARLAAEQKQYERAPFQYPLYKLFLITAAYALAFGAFGQLGAVGIFVATWLGTTGSLIILAARSKTDVLLAVRAAAVSLLVMVVLDLPFVVTAAVTVTEIPSAVPITCVALGAGATFIAVLCTRAIKREQKRHAPKEPDDLTNQ